MRQLVRTTPLMILPCCEFIYGIKEACRAIGGGLGFDFAKLRTWMGT
jgi:hypothetical protein